jgi:hypothetical protein
MGAAAFFLYSRLIYAERKIGLIESILLDIKMSMEMEEEHAHALPPKEAPVFSPVVDETGSGPTGTVNPSGPSTEDDIAYYSSVIESATSEASQVASEVPEPVPAPASALNYDAYTRDELAAIAEKRGLRVTKRMSKGAITDLLRGSEQTSSAAPVSGDEQPLGGLGDGAPLDSGRLEEVELSV